jgi:DHA1 family multidrug resistance protein-like MFS transporter
VPQSLEYEQDPAKQQTWVGLLVLFTIAGFVETIFFGQLNAFIPLYLPRLGISPASVAAWTGALVATSSAIGIPFLPLWGALADRYARQPVIARSYLVELSAALIMLLAKGIWVFVIGRTLTCLSLGNSGLMLATLSERTPPNRRGLAFSIANGAPPFGAFLGPLLSGPILDRWGFPALMGIDCVLLLLVFLAVNFGYRDPFKGTNQGPLLGMAVDSVRIIAESRRLRSLFPALFLLFSGWLIVTTYVSLAVRDLYHGSSLGTAVGLVLGAGGLTTLVLSPIVGLLADRFGHWGTLFVGAGLTTVLWIVPALTKGLVGFGVTWALVNGLASAIFAISFSVLSSSAPEEVRGRVMSFAYLPLNLGFVIGPAIGSLVTATTVFAVFPTAAILTFLGLAGLWVSARQS